MRHKRGKAVDSFRRPWRMVSASGKTISSENDQQSNVHQRHFRHLPAAFDYSTDRPIFATTNKHEGLFTTKQSVRVLYPQKNPGIFSEFLDFFRIFSDFLKFVRVYEDFKNKKRI